VIALATADLKPLSIDEDLDLPFLAQAFAGRAPVEFVFWDDPSVDWAKYDLVVLRSTWGYSLRLAEFTGWLRKVEGCTRLLNAAGTAEWNLDKAYLGVLAAGGVPVVRTAYVGTLEAFDTELAAIGSEQVVVKPTVSAGSYLTGRFEHDDPAARELAGRILAQGKQIMLQPYYRSVTEQGEIAVIHFNGEFSHAVRKGPLLELGGGFLGGEYTEVVEAVQPSPAVLAAAEAALARYRELAAVEPVLAGTAPLLYSRVDLIQGDQGEPLCMELELIEPSLFFETDDKAATRFVDAVLARL
jgi:hypothetical protein